MNLLIAVAGQDSIGQNVRQRTNEVAFNDLFGDSRNEELQGVLQELVLAPSMKLNKSMRTL